MKKSITLLLTLLVLCSKLHATSDVQKPGQLKADSSAVKSVKSINNQPINITLASEAKAPQSTNPNYTLVAAVIAALASLASASMAFLSKNKDFSNEYYKRIIEKRFKVYQDVESVLYELRANKLLGGDDDKVYASVFENKGKFKAFMDKMNAVLLEGFWLSKQERHALGSLFNLFNKIGRDIIKEKNELWNTEEEIDENSLYKNKGVEHRKDVEHKAVMVGLYLRKDLAELYKVKPYLKGLIKQSEVYVRNMDSTNGGKGQAIDTKKSS
jgi:hypothetical protein